MAASSINTGRVKDRRKVHYDSYDEVLADARHMASIPTRTLGNWSVGQIYKHLSIVMDGMIDGIPFGAPSFLRGALRWFLMPWFLHRQLPAGFKLPKEGEYFVPTDTATEEGLELLSKAIARLQATQARAPHPGFGKVTCEQWDLLQLRHCEMHMSFILPVAEASNSTSI
jgi:hypothetical protein